MTFWMGNRDKMFFFGRLRLQVENMSAIRVVFCEEFQVGKSAVAKVGMFLDHLD